MEFPIKEINVTQKSTFITYMEQFNENVTQYNSNCNNNNDSI